MSVKLSPLSSEFHSKFSTDSRVIMKGQLIYRVESFFLITCIMKLRFVHKQSHRDSDSLLSALCFAGFCCCCDGGVADPPCRPDLSAASAPTHDLTRKDAKVEADRAGFSFTASYWSKHTQHTARFSVVSTSPFFFLFFLFERTRIHPDWAPVVLYIVAGKYLVLQLSCWPA